MFRFFLTLAMFLALLKLFGVIDWDWGWVTAPIWMPAVIVICVVLLIIKLIGEHN